MFLFLYQVGPTFGTKSGQLHLAGRVSAADHQILLSALKTMDTLQSVFPDVPLAALARVVRLLGPRFLLDWGSFADEERAVGLVCCLSL